MSKIPISRTLIIVCWVIAWVLLIYSIYYQFRKATISERQTAFKLTLYSGLGIGFLYLLIYKHLEFWIITSSSYVIGLLWSILTGLIFYMYFNVSGLLKTKSNNRYELFIVFIMLYLSITGLGYFGLRIVITEKCFIYNWLYYHKFQTNSYKGIKFIGYNLWYLIILFFISFLTEREI